MQTGSQVFQQRSYQQTTDKRNYVNGTTNIEDFKVLQLNVRCFNRITI